MGNGWTPNIETEYKETLPNGSFVSNQLDYFSTGFGDFVGVAAAPTNVNCAHVILMPDSGWEIVLNSFDLAAYILPRQAAAIQVRDMAGNVLWSASSLSIPGGSTHVSFAPNIRSAAPIEVYWGNDWNIGLKNVNFDQALVPEPASLVILAIGCSMALRRRRQLRDA